MEVMADTATIKESSDIVAIVGERVKLARAGQSWRGLCPFHSEKTPSFHVNPNLQRYICFGCGNKGDVINFLMEYDKLTFHESLQYLAERAGLKLDEWRPDPQEHARQQQLEALELAAQYYHFLLTKHAVGKSALSYVTDRGLKPDLTIRFLLGYAPLQVDGLVSYLVKKKKIPPQIVESAGLAYHRGNRMIDRFHDRLMFPLSDHRGRVVGFSGRLLDVKAKEAKYINTPETDLYHKRQLLYGYYQNLNAIRKEEEVLVVEGEFDMLSSVQAHIDNVVAIKGSALTVDMLRVLSRTVRTVILALDNDKAGLAATERAIEAAQSFPINVRVLPLVDGKDPDDIARQDPKHWREMVKSATQPAFEFLLNALASQVDLHSVEGQKSLTDQLLPLISKIDHPVERTFYERQLAAKLGVSDSVLSDQREQMVRRALIPQKMSRQQEAVPTGDQLGEHLLRLLFAMQSPDRELVGMLDPKWFSEPIHQQILTELQKYNLDSWSARTFWQKLPTHLQEGATALLVSPWSAEDLDLPREIAVVTAQLRERWHKRRRQAISDDLKVLEAKDVLTSDEEDRYEALQREFQQLVG